MLNVDYTGLRVESTTELKNLYTGVIIPKNTRGVVTKSYKSAAFGWVLTVKFDGFGSGFLSEINTREGETVPAY